MNYSSIPLWSRLWAYLPSVFLFICLWPLGLLGTSVRAQTFLPVEQAFRVEVQPTGAHEVRIAFRLAPGVYLYREQMSAQWQADAQPVQPLPWDLPAGQSKHDPNFDRILEVYHADVDSVLRLPPSQAHEAVLTVGYQGCADAGICYPPQKRHFTLRWSPQGTLSVHGRDVADARMLQEGASEIAVDEGSALQGQIREALASGRLWAVVSVFFVAGVLLSLTPCVLPMVPILSSIIVGQGASVGRARGFALALSYTQGMALVYTGLGLAAGLLGQGLAAYLQHPWVVLAFAAMMLLLALSMFGLYELQLPASVQSYLGAGSSKLPGGRFVSVFAMGVVSALIVSPCVSAPLAGALLYISQTHDVWLGGSALYAMACGMSMPLLLVGLSAGSLLPRAGAWMTTVKALFGVIMVVMAVWVSRPAWPYVQTQWLGQQADGARHQSVLPFQRVRDVAELEEALAQARAQGQAVMLDFYADWCTSCLEMEHRTFADAQVQDRLRGVRVLQADVTLNGAADRALLQRFQLFGPPGIIFFDPTGREQTAVRVIGFQPPSDFLQSLSRAGL